MGIFSVINANVVIKKNQTTNWNARIGIQIFQSATGHFDIPQGNQSPQWKLEKERSQSNAQGNLEGKPSALRENEGRGEQKDSILGLGN